MNCDQLDQAERWVRFYSARSSANPVVAEFVRSRLDYWQGQRTRHNPMESMDRLSNPSRQGRCAH
jgi:hypothetical protein